MTKEVKLDGVGALPLPAAPKLVKKKYTITGEGADAAAIALKAKLATQKGVVRQGPSAPKLDSTAGKQLAQTQLLKQAVAKNTTTGVTTSTEVTAMLHGQAATGQVRLQKIVLPPALFGKPDPRLLQSAAGKMGTGPQVAASLQDAGSVFQLIGQLQEQVGEVGFLNDYQLMLLLIQVNANQRKDNHAIRDGANTTQIALAQLHEVQTKIDNSAAKFDAFFGALDSAMKFNETVSTMGPEGAKIGADLKEGLARAKADHAQTDVDHAQRELTAATATPSELASQLGTQGSAPSMAAAIAGTPVAPAPLAAGATAPTSEQLAAAEASAKTELADAQRASPPNPSRVATARSGVATARSNLVAHDAQHPDEAHPNPTSGGPPETGRQRIARIGEETKQEAEGERPPNGPVAMGLRAQAGTMLAVQADLAMTVGANGAKTDNPDSIRFRRQSDAQFRAIDTATGSPATAARVRADAATFRGACGSANPAQVAADRAPLQTMVAGTPDGHGHTTGGLIAAHHQAVAARDAAAIQLRSASLSAATIRLSIEGHHPLPPAAVNAAAEAHANAEVTHFTSPLQTQLETAREQLAVMRTTTTPPLPTADQIALKQEQIGDLQDARTHETEAADVHARTLYGTDGPGSTGVWGHQPGLIEKVSSLVYSGDISETDAARSYLAVGAATSQYVGTSSADPAAHTQADVGLGHAEAALNRTYEEVQFKQNDRAAVWPAHTQTLTAHENAVAAKTTAAGALEVEQLAYDRLQTATPPTPEAQLEAQATRVGVARATLSTATAREGTLSAESDFEARGGPQAPSAAEIAHAQQIVGIPEPAAQVVPPGGSPVPVATAPPAATLLGVQAQQVALQAQRNAHATADSANRTALLGAPTDPALLATRDRLATQGQALQTQSTALTMKTQSLTAELRAVTAGQERRAQEWADPAPAPRPPPSLTTSPTAPVLAPVVAAVPRTWDGYSHAVEAADAAVPPLEGRPFQGSNSANDPLTNEVKLRQYYAAMPAPKPSFDEARAAALRTADPVPAATDPASTAQNAFTLATRAVELHRSLDGPLSDGTHQFTEHWTPQARATFLAARDTLTAAAARWAGQPVAPETDGTAGRILEPTVADTQGTATDQAAEERRSAATAYIAAKTAYAQAQQAGTTTATDPPTRPAGMRPPESTTSIGEKIMGGFQAVASGINQAGFAQASIRLRHGMEQIRDEAQRKAEQVAGAARSTLLHATDGEGGRWRGTLDTIRKLVEASAKGR